MIDFEKLTNLIADKKCMSSDWNEKDDPFVGIYLSDLVDVINQCDFTKWISVDEALPPIRENDIENRSWSDWVLIMTHKGGVFMDCYAFHRKEWLNNGNDVTYWMPIPELPKGDDE